MLVSGREEEMSRPADFREAGSQVSQACTAQLPHPGWDSPGEEPPEALGTGMLGQHPSGPTFPALRWGLTYACYSLSNKAQAAHSTSGGGCPTECW